MVATATLLSALWLGPASAQTPAKDASALDGGDSDPVAARLGEEAAHVRALVDDRLEAAIEPASLFDVDLTDGAAVALERARLQALVRAANADAAGKVRRKPTPKASDVDGGVDAAADRVPSSEQWEARLELDRARLAFFELPPARRDELLEHHRARMAAAEPPEADRRAAEAEAQRQQALASAQMARTEAERVVSEEYARLLSIEAKQSAFAKKLAAGREKIDAGREATLVWERRTREIRTHDVAPEIADRTYADLRKALRAARDELAQALADARGGASSVPVAGPDPLGSLQINVDLGKVRGQRDRVEAEATRLAADEKAFHDERASQLLEEVDELNAERLALLPYLSSAKHAAIIGFTDAGWDQASSELRQLTLIARYHRFVASAWLATVRRDHGLGGLSAGAIARVVFEWLAVIAAFAWVRRRLPIAVQLVLKRARAEDRRLRLPRPSLPSRVAGFAVQTYRPVLWLLLAVVLSRLLPDSARGVLEIQILSIVVQWVFGGAFIVAMVNALAGVASVEEAPRGAPVLRLRSLQLVGRVVVAFGLVLAITSRLVGPGTIYRWVFSTCWLASVPVFLVLVRWWREKIFERADRPRKKTAFEVWILAQRRGWRSVLAATAGAVYLFARGAWRVGRSWIGGFKLTRSVLAYLFRRELGKLEAEREAGVSKSIADAAFDALGPDRTSPESIALDVDDDLARVLDRVQEKKGGVVAIVGPRGMGKTSLLAHLRREVPACVWLDTPIDAGEGFAETAAAAVAAKPDGSLVLVDDAHRLVRPIMGGLAPFDALLAVAIESSTTTTWVLAFDEILWLFLQRARGSRPLFDEVVQLYPWREEQLVELLTRRTTDVGLDPSFAQLLDRLPANADEIDRQEALDARAASYYRLLWDYAGGNPGIALHMWRRALGADESGGIHVRFFQAPNVAELEQLPDQTIFVLRAVLQLEGATPEEIAAATMLQHADILDALRYARSRRYLRMHDRRYAVTWTWHRALTVFLKRRHLLVRS